MPPIERGKSAEADEDKENLISLRRDLEKAFKSGENCDMAIALSNGETIECHRAILCNRSTFFANALKPGRFKEGTTGTVEMLDDPPTAIKALVEFLYTAGYKLTTVKRKQRYTKKEKQEASNTLMHIAEVYAVAAVYGAPQLMRRMHGYFHAFYALIPHLSTLIRALRHIFNWVPEERCLIRRDGHFLKACMKYLYLDSGERKEMNELDPDFFMHLDKHAWKLIEDDCDNWACNWLGEVRGTRVR
ncbi:putative btb poz domain-containing protein [Diplodia seriata]|uniref:Putative btb poz domain-containing protein n=1 Tax=Diplodia seriata TaxID=420778 RepID=A0A0G2FPX4_9PEZI|nr:putative btb poz domain-containing protein [Diplodia seriata]